MEKEFVDIINTDGTSEEVELVTYLISDDKKSQFIVYTKGEIQGEKGNQVIYISKLNDNNGEITLAEITDDAEWNLVQQLLKKIANA